MTISLDNPLNRMTLEYTELHEEQHRIDALWEEVGRLRDRRQQQAVSLDFPSDWNTFSTAFINVNLQSQAHYLRLMDFHQRHTPSSSPAPPTSTAMVSESKADSVSDSDDSDDSDDDLDEDDTYHKALAASTAAASKSTTKQFGSSKAAALSIPPSPIPEESDEESVDSDESMEPGEIAVAPTTVSRSEHVGECMVGGKLCKVRQVVRRPVSSVTQAQPAPQQEARVLRSGKHLASPSLQRS